MPFTMEKGEKTQFLSIFFLRKLQKEPVNRRILRLFAAKFYKPDRLLDNVCPQSKFLCRTPDINNFSFPAIEKFTERTYSIGIKALIGFGNLKFLK